MYCTIMTVKGEVYGNTLSFVEKDKAYKFETKQKNLSRKKGFIQFIREANGVCDILRIVEE